MSDDAIEKCKAAITVIHEQLEALRVGRSEQARVASIAITQLETTELWTLKALYGSTE